ncbi:class I SAM-dependent methyltransferase family protein [Candidatus Micrarchaeota archaeon]|nr:class I SAM-dependent methyltransferase family protein [Candidatus Micrarchaeota archaeon]
MKYLKVPRAKGEKVRKELIEEGLFVSDYPIISEDLLILFPVTKKWKTFQLVERKVSKREKIPLSLEDALSKTLSSDQLASLKTSFDIVGDIAIVEIPDELVAKENQIGDALLRVHKNIHTVLKKLGAMEGEFRVRRFECIAGIKTTKTIYKENGVLMKLDLAKVYFSPRLATERKRIADLVSDKEQVLVLFAGIGPFAFAIAKEHPEARIFANELNPDAVLYLRENIKLNKFKNIEPIEGDARQIISQNKKYRNFFDRILMPLPKSAEDFLDVAFELIKDSGIIHFYTIVSSYKAFEEAIEKAEQKAKESGVRIEIQHKRVVRPYSPSKVQVVLDLLISKP